MLDRGDDCLEAYLRAVDKVCITFINGLSYALEACIYVLNVYTMSLLICLAHIT